MHHCCASCRTPFIHASPVSSVASAAASAAASAHASTSVDNSPGFISQARTLTANCHTGWLRCWSWQLRGQEGKDARRWAKYTRTHRGKVVSQRTCVSAGVHVRAAVSDFSRCARFVFLTGSGRLTAPAESVRLIAERKERQSPKQLAQLAQATGPRNTLQPRPHHVTARHTHTWHCKPHCVVNKVHSRVVTPVCDVF